MREVTKRIEAARVARAEQDAQIEADRVARLEREAVEAKKRAEDREAMRVRIKELLDNPFLGNYDRDTVFELAKLAGYSQEAINV